MICNSLDNDAGPVADPQNILGMDLVKLATASSSTDSSLSVQVRPEWEQQLGPSADDCNLAKALSSQSDLTNQHKARRRLLKQRQHRGNLAQQQTSDCLPPEYDESNGYTPLQHELTVPAVPQAQKPPSRSTETLTQRYRVRLPSPDPDMAKHSKGLSLSFFQDLESGYKSKVRGDLVQVQKAHLADSGAWTGLMEVIPSRSNETSCKGNSSAGLGLGCLGNLKNSQTGFLEKPEEP
jgi:hypothetical protein